MKRHLVIGLALLMLIRFSSVVAGEWDAQTTRTNTSVTDQDIRSALSQGLDTAFTRTFPARQFGIHVLVDRHLSAPINGELVYLSLALCQKLSQGEYLLGTGRLSDVVVLPRDTSPDKERQAVTQKLAAMASAFSQLMVQHKTGAGSSTQTVPKPSPHWSQWPDYKR